MILPHLVPSDHKDANVEPLFQRVSNVNTVVYER